MTGTVKTIVYERGFLFARGDDGIDYFVHSSALPSEVLFDELQRGDSVLLVEVKQTEKGWRCTQAVPQAASVALTPTQDTQQEQQAQQPEENTQPAA